MWQSCEKRVEYILTGGEALKPHRTSQGPKEGENTACLGTACTGKFILNVPLQAWKLLVSFDSVEMVARSLHEMSCYCPSTISHRMLVFIK